MTIRIVLILMVLVSVSTGAHHSTAGFYDPDDIIEIQGVIKSASMRNPHVHFVVTVNMDGVDVDWRVESVSLSSLQIRGYDQDFLVPGRQIRVAGERSRRDETAMYASHVLLENGTEVMMLLRGELYFSAEDREDVLQPIFDPDVEDAARGSAEGIFRVWSSVLKDPQSVPILKGVYPLTEVAEEARANWNPAGDDLLGCYEKGMPQLMESPLPVEFLRDGDNIVLRFQEGENAHRVIHMTEDSANLPEHSFRGYSKGRWEGETLVVETTRISAGRFDGSGVAQSDEISLIERFDLREDENRLDYRLTVSDPATFTRTFELRKYWVWRPEISILAWECDLTDPP